MSRAGPSSLYQLMVAQLMVAQLTVGVGGGEDWAEARSTT